MCAASPNRPAGLVSRGRSAGSFRLTRIYPRWPARDRIGHESLSNEQGLLDRKSWIGEVIDAKNRNCSPPGELAGYAALGSGSPLRVRRMAWSTPIDLRRAVSTTDLTLA